MTGVESESVRVTVADGVATATLDRPPANALDKGLAGELERLCGRAAIDDGTRAILFVSANPRFFMAGGDIHHYRNKTPEELAGTVAVYRRAFRELQQVPVPTIAAIDGYALGGGSELALACDFRVVGPNARLGVPEIELGGLPSATGTFNLPRLVGYEKALELMMLGQAVEGEEAVRIGLASRFADDVAAAGAGLAGEIAAKPPVAIRWIKRCARAALVGDPTSHGAIEDEATAAIAATSEFTERVEAFVKRSEARH